MKNNTKTALGSIVIATALLGGHTYIKDANSQSVNQILCEKQGNEETIWHNTGIVVSNNEGYCYISPNNIGFRNILIKLKEKQGFNNLVAFPITTHRKNPNIHLIKIDGTIDETTHSYYYQYNNNKGTMQLINAEYQEAAIKAMTDK